MPVATSLKIGLCAVRRTRPSPPAGWSTRCSVAGTNVLAEERVMEGSQYLDGMWHYTQGSAQVGLGNFDNAQMPAWRISRR